MLDAYHEGVRATGSRLGWWASLPREAVLGDPSTAERRLSGLLGDGASGLQVPATWLEEPEGVLALRPLLSRHSRRLTGRCRPPRPGPGRGRRDGHPEWWAPVVDYSAQMAAAWWSWHAVGRAGLPTLRICFAAGAGLAPVHQERLRARGGQVAPVDPRTFVDLSGYGPQAFDALLRVLGIDVLDLGERPPVRRGAHRSRTDAAAHHAIRSHQPTPTHATEASP